MNEQQTIEKIVDQLAEMILGGFSDNTPLEDCRGASTYGDRLRGLYFDWYANHWGKLPPKALMELTSKSIIKKYSENLELEPYLNNVKERLKELESLGQNPGQVLEVLLVAYDHAWEQHRFEKRSEKDPPEKKDPHLQPMERKKIVELENGKYAKVPEDWVYNPSFCARNDVTYERWIPPRREEWFERWDDDE